MRNRSKSGWCTLCIVAWLSYGCSNTPAASGAATDTTAGGVIVPAGSPAPVTAGSTAGAPTAGTGAPASGGAVAPAPASSGAGTTASAGAGAASAAAGSAASSATAGAPSTALAGSAAAGSGAVPGSAYPDLRGGCTINSGYPDDHACLPAPAPEEGLQIHVGPTNYQDATEVAKYIMKPGDESSECWTFHTPNDKEVYYQTFVLSGRAGTHHIINTMYNTEMADGGFGTCADPGTGTNSNIIDNLPGASKAYMPRGTVAPENEHIGRKIPPKTTAQADMHYYNFTDHDIIREFWMNIYYAKAEDITQTGDQIRAMGGISWQGPLGIAPKTDMVYKYECPITGNGRIMSLLGHYHSHGKRFTASIRRKASTVDKVFEMYDYMDPANFEYDTVNQNPMFSENGAGAVSGMLMVNDGDTLLWECHIVNDSDVTLTYVNAVKTGEMCNLWGESLGITALNCVLP